MFKPLQIKLLELQQKNILILNKKHLNSQYPHANIHDLDEFCKNSKPI